MLLNLVSLTEVVILVVSPKHTIRYPYGFMALDSPPPYGSYKSLSVTKACPGLSTIEYQTEYGEAYLLIIGPVHQLTLSVDFSCEVTHCHSNQYFDGTVCTDCPEGSISLPGSSSFANCTQCEDGLSVLHPKMAVCAWKDNETMAHDTDAPSQSPSVPLSPTQFIPRIDPPDETLLLKPAAQHSGSLVDRLTDMAANFLSLVRRFVRGTS